eukprot:scaffold8577_cov119-Skeletonema_marinoi.AAC.1
METYATSVLDMTADVEVDETHVTDTSSDSISPLKHRFSECYNRKEDVRMLTITALGTMAGASRGNAGLITARKVNTASVTPPASPASKRRSLL